MNRRAATPTHHSDRENTMKKKSILFAGLLTILFTIGIGYAIESGRHGTRGTDIVAVDPLTDGKIAMIAVVAGNIDIAYAHLAMALSSDPAVRRFARTMLTDHAAVNEGAGKLVEKIGIEPVESEISRTLRKQSRAIIDELTALRGAEFDRRYAANELEYHEFVNTALRDQFIPSVQDPRFRGALEDALAVFEGHEKMARSMVRSVGR